MKPEKIQEYSSAAAPAVISQALKTHTVQRYEQNGDPTHQSYIGKRIIDEKPAREEMMAQEFFRLIIPHQPVTRLVYDHQPHFYYIFSGEVEGYEPLPEGQPDEFTNGTYTGLGQVAVVAMFVEERDLKNGNIGYNKATKKIYKIDGDCCFSEFKKAHQSFTIDEDTIEQLPYPGFYVFNWLNIYCQGLNENQSNIKPQHRIVNAVPLSQAPHFRAELNQAFLKICMLPDCYVEAFVDECMGTYNPQKYISLLVQRRNSLTDAVLENDSFKLYLESPQALVDAKGILDQMRMMKVGGTTQLNSQELQENLIKDFMARAVKFNGNADLLNAFSTKLANFLECHKLLDAIKYTTVPGLADALKGDISAREAEINANANNNGIIKKHRTELALLADCVQRLGIIKGVATEKPLKDYVDGKAKELIANKDNPDQLNKLKSELSEVAECIILLTRVLELANNSTDESIRFYISEKMLELNENISAIDLKQLKEELELRIECTELIRKIESKALWGDDPLTKKYVQQKFAKIWEVNDIQELKNLRDDIKKVHVSVHSKEVDIVKAKVVQEEQSKAWYTKNKDEKAKQIKEAMLDTPLEKRGTVISANDDNKVLVALHYDRSKGATPMADGKIDQTKAIQSARDLKAEVSRLRQEETAKQQQQPQNVEPTKSSNISENN